MSELFALGNTFDSFKEFNDAFQQWCDLNWHPTTTI
jgi:hypothetical protein